MQFLRAVAEGFLIAGLYQGINQYCIKTGKKPGFKIPAVFVLILLSTLSTVSIYRVQENSNYFFWHPYLSWLVVDLVDFAFCHHSYKEKLILWPLVIIPVIAGFELAVGWLIKLYVWKI